MKKIVRLTESDLIRLVKRVIKEETDDRRRINRKDSFVIPKKKNEFSSEISINDLEEIYYDWAEGRQFKEDDDIDTLWDDFSKVSDDIYNSYAQDNPEYNNWESIFEAIKTPRMLRALVKHFNPKKDQRPKSDWS